MLCGVLIHAVLFCLGLYIFLHSVQGRIGNHAGKLHVLLKKLGIPDGSFHAWRHGATSELLENGAAPTVVQRQMWHSDARITLGVYGHVVGDAQRRAVEQHAERIEQHAREAQLEPRADIGPEFPVTV